MQLILSLIPSPLDQALFWETPMDYVLESLLGSRYLSAFIY